jgi:hypothetical protein
VRVPSSLAVIICSFVFGISGGCGTTSDIDRAAGAITRQGVRTEIDYIASDALQGRNTPSPGLDTAAEYIVRTFVRAGLRPVAGSYFQTFKLHTVSLGDSNLLEVTTAAGTASLTLGDDFIPFEITADRAVDAELVFAGYGITAPEYHYDDYAGIDVRGKIVFVLRHEPGEEDAGSVFEGKKATKYSSVLSKMRQAREHGAVGMLVATDPLNHTSLVPRGFPWPSLSKFIPRDLLPTSLAMAESEKLPVVHVGEGAIRLLCGGVDSLRRLQSAIDRASAPRSFAVRGTRVHLRTSTIVQESGTQNVVGVLEGIDPLRRNELVIVGAHYDHLGVIRNSPAGTDSIFNGADDNGSGTVALLEIAKALGAMPRKPLRSILLIAFAGEEKGLFGSISYTRNPLFPLDSTVAMLNMDMVGRNGEDSLQLIGAPEESFLMRAAREENAAVGFRLVRTSVASGGSDHESFEKQHIPVLFYHSGLHPEYHQTGDEARLISDAKIARVADLVFRTAWHVANQEDSLIHPSLRGNP